MIPTFPTGPFYFPVGSRVRFPVAEEGSGEGGSGPKQFSAPRQTCVQHSQARAWEDLFVMSNDSFSYGVGEFTERALRTALGG